MRIPLLVAATLAFGLAGCDAVAPSAVADAGGLLTCGAPTLHSITPGGSNWVNISYTQGASNGTVGIIGHVEVREVGTRTWLDAESTSSSTTITAYQLNEPSSGGTAYQVRARQTCRRGTIDVDFEQTTSPYSNSLTDDLIYYPVGQFPGGGA